MTPFFNLCPPAKTKTVPIHCLVTKLFPKKITEAKTVKNFLIKSIYLCFFNLSLFIMT